MIIQLNESWRIASDELQWTLQHLPPAKDPSKPRKSETWKNRCYYRHLDDCIRAAVIRQVRLLEGHYPPEALTMLTTALDRIEAEVKAALAGYVVDAEALVRRAKS